MTCNTIKESQRKEKASLMNLEFVVLLIPPQYVNITIKIFKKKDWQNINVLVFK